jgi:hypothetical protein
VGEDEPELSDEALAAKIAAARAKHGLPAAAKTRTGKEKSLKRRMKIAVLTKTWRSMHWTVRCREDYPQRIKAAVKQGAAPSVAAAMEEAMEAWLKAHEGNEGGDV